MKATKKERKRAPCGGRKPGEFGKLGAVMGLRLPEDLKEQLRQAAEQGDRSLSGEMIRRLRSSFAPGRIKFRTAHDQSANEVQTAVLGEVASFAKKVVLLLENKDLLNPQWRKRGGHK